jgi:hypothetical protein
MNADRKRRHTERTDRQIDRQNDTSLNSLSLQWQVPLRK